MHGKNLFLIIYKDVASLACFSTLDSQWPSQWHCVSIEAFRIGFRKGMVGDGTSKVLLELSMGFTRRGPNNASPEENAMSIDALRVGFLNAMGGESPPHGKGSILCSDFMSMEGYIIGLSIVASPLLGFGMDMTEVGDI